MAMRRAYKPGRRAVRKLYVSRWPRRSVVCHPKLAGWSGAIPVLGPEHYAMLSLTAGAARMGGWPQHSLQRPGHEPLPGVGGIEEGIDLARAEEMIDKFNDGTCWSLSGRTRGRHVRCCGRLDAIADPKKYKL